MLPEYRTILCAVDLGGAAPLVLRHALSLARRFCGSVFVVHALEPLGPSARQMFELYAGAEAARQDEQRWGQVQDQLRERLRDLCAGEPCCAADGRDLVGGTSVRRGRPAEVILKEAARIGADAIVLGAHGHSTFGEVLLGSTAHRVAQKSPVPVLLVRLAADGAGGGP